MNRSGNAASLAPHPGNAFTAKHGAYSERLREPRAREIAEQVMTAPWASQGDEIWAAEIGRLVALTEALDDAIATGGIIGKGDKVRRPSWSMSSASRPRSSAERSAGPTPCTARRSDAELQLEGATRSGSQNAEKM